MYPPHVSDQTIRTLIKELAQGDRLPSGAALRAALRKRHGCSGGVTRIYRLLAQARPKPPPPPAALEQQKLEREIRSLRQSAQLADHREQAHQTRWALEVDQLRQRVAALEPAAAQATRALENAELLRRQLYAAHVRIAALEQELLAKDTQAGQGT
jgi:predicted RNase H-like nuclease (RuvC/YqgF family)